MSAITGIYYFDGRPVTQHEIAGMVESMPHRGPDGREIWYQDSVGLGHCMLHTTPESLQEHLPITADSGNIVLTADARIDNRKELFSSLSIDEPSEILPDSELILRAYQKWGKNCLEHLLGDFAFAIWDKQKRQLFLARDHFGIKPLFYSFDKERQFLFGTEIKAILSHPDSKEELNEPVIGVYLANEVEPVETIFKNIIRLLPGHAMVVSPQKTKTWKYWELTPTEISQDLSDEEYTEQFLDLFTEAVRCRLRSAFPIGSELSGGLDSSFVTTVARDLLREEGQLPLHSFSSVYNNVPECDEREYIEEILKSGDILPHYCTVDEHGVFEVLDEIYKYLDDGRVAGNHYLNWLSAKEAGKSGARILLTGQDGDTTVGHGYQIFDELASNAAWKTFAEEAEKVVSIINRNAGSMEIQEGWKTTVDALNGYGSKYLARWIRNGQYIKLLWSVFLINRYFPVRLGILLREILKKLQIPVYLRKNTSGIQKNVSIPAILNEEFSNRIGLKERLQKLERYKGIGANIRETQRQSLEAPYAFLGMELVELYSGAHGIESRHPFMDKRLIEFVLGLPIDQSYKDGWSRIIMRRAMEGKVPESIQWRTNKVSLSKQRRYLYFEKDLQKLEQVYNNVDFLGEYIDIKTVNRYFDNKHELNYHEFSSFVNTMHLNYWLQSRSE